jgi:hypothetical protein
MDATNLVLLAGAANILVVPALLSYAQNPKFPSSLEPFSASLGHVAGLS